MTISGIYEFRLTAYQVIEPAKGMVLAAPGKNKVDQSPPRRTLIKAKEFFKGLFVGQGDSRLGKAGFYTSKFIPVYGDGSDIILGFANWAQGEGFDWTTIGLSTVGLALDLIPPAKGADVLVTVIKNTNRLCGKEVANRLVKVAWEMGSDKAKRNALLKMSWFMATEIDLLPKLLKNADDMTEFGKFFAKYGDEAGTLLKKFKGLEEEAFEVYKKGGKLEFTRNVLKDPKGRLAWLEEGNDAGGWIHIKKKHITGEIPGGSKFPEKFGVSDENTIEKWIYESIKSVEPTQVPGYPNRWQYIYEPLQDGRKMKTIIDNGYTITSYPL